jgi:leucyl/phenylalanyl-tRNA---protein transferase
VHLVEALTADGRAERLLDVQWSTPHLASLGVIEMARHDYLDRGHRLPRALELPMPAIFM